VIVGMNRTLARERRAGELAATVGNHLVNVHVKLRPTARHPYMQWEHVVMLAGQDLVTGINDQLVPMFIQALAEIVGVGGCFLQNRVRRNHLARNEVFADAEVLKGALGLSAPKPIGWDFDFAERIFLYSDICIIQSVFLFS
jgi:hypothetical protein